MPISRINNNSIANNTIVSADLAAGSVTGDKIAPSVTLTTPIISGNLSLDSTGTTGVRVPSANTISFYEGGVEAVRIDSSGNMGIGASSISNKLEVVQSASADASAAVRAGTNGYAASLKLIANDATGSRYNTLNSFYGSTEQWSIRSGAADSTMTFCTGSSATERMRITSGGLVGINTTSFPYTEQLRVNFPNTQGLHLNETTESSSVNYIYLTKGSSPTNVGAAFYNGSSVAWQTTSDYRLKENIVPLTNALNVVGNLKPKSYRWKESQQDDTGFIAHELQELFPLAVSGQKDAVDADGNPMYQGVDVSFLVATLTAAIQELKTTVDAQAARIAALETPPAPTPVES
jgi:hypothetical protein